MGITDGTILVGIDGGGSGCRVAVCDGAGRRLGGATGGAANYYSDAAGAIARIRATLDAALADAGIAGTDPADFVAHAGLAGVMTASDARAVADAMPLRRITVTDDRETSLAGALGASDGVLAAIGTGTIVAARTARGRRNFGGWGFDAGDQASGAWLGLGALRLTLKAQDGIVPQSGLTRDLLARFGGDPVALVVFARDAAPGDHAALARGVIDAARAGDPGAEALMRRGADYLNACLRAAGPGDTDAVCLTGGIGPHYAGYLDPAIRPLVRPAAGTALDGAVHLAQRALEQMEAVT